MVKIIRIRRKGTRKTLGGSSSIIVMFTFPEKYSSCVYRWEETRNMIMHLARIRENGRENKRERGGGEDRELRNFNYVRKKLPSKKPFFIKITLDQVLVLPKQNVRFPVMFLTRERKRARRNIIQRVKEWTKQAVNEEERKRKGGTAVSSEERWRRMYA